MAFGSQKIITDVTKYEKNIDTAVHFEYFFTYERTKL